MKITGSQRRRPARSSRSGTRCSTRGVLVATIPGCERLEATGENAYAMTVTAGVAAIKGTYAGSCALSDLKEHESLVMKLQGAGAPGTVDATVDVRLRRAGAGAHPDRLRGRRGRRRHGRRRRPADARPRSPSGWRASSSATSAPSIAARARRPLPRPAAAAASGRRRPAPRSSPRPPKAGGISLAGRLPQGHRRRRRAGAARRGRRRRLRPAAVTPMTDLTVDSTARDQAAAVRRREISARELLDLHLARIAERNPELNAIVSLDEERARAGAAAADEALAARRRGRAAARAAVRVQGHPRGRRLADDVRLAALRRPRPRRRRAARRAGTPRRAWS